MTEVTEMDDWKRDETGQFAEGNHSQFRHGGEAAIKDLQRNRPLRGVARDLAQECAVELAENGYLATMEHMLIDHMAVTRLFYGLILAAETEGEVDKLTQRFGWLNSKCFNMLRDLEKLGRESGSNAQTLDVLLSQSVADG